MGGELEGGGREVETLKEGRGTVPVEKEHELKVDQAAQESDDVMTKEEDPQDVGTLLQVG